MLHRQVMLTSMLSNSLKNLFRRPVTTKYPAVPADIPSENRGKVVWDMPKCIWCKRCERNCPTNAIRTDKSTGTQRVARNRCIGCRTCVEVCPTQTITMLPEYSSASTELEVHVFDLKLPKWEYRTEHLPKGGKRELI